MIAAATGVATAALAVSPVRLRLTRFARRTITIVNSGQAAATIDARPAQFVLDPRGRPIVLPKHRAGGWLRLRPRHLVVAPGATAELTVSAVTPRRARPGDHPALVLLTTKPPHRSGVAVRMQIGVVVFVRVSGRIVHHLEPGALKAVRRTLEATVANRGNVVELTRVRIALSRGGHVLARLRSASRTFLPHSRGIERMRYPRRLRGWVTAQVKAGTFRRTFRLRL